METVTSARRPELGTGARRWAAGLSMFGAVMLISVGFLQALQGLAAIINDGFFVVVATYPYEVNTTVWGWIHLTIGIVLAVVGYAVLAGAIWARAIGILVSAVSILTNFLFIPYYPLWSILLIALDVGVIWALTVYSPARRESFTRPG